jgi:hypothetical protein
MSHHVSGPNFTFPRGDARLDLTDFYAFTNLLDEFPYLAPPHS